VVAGGVYPVVYIAEALSVNNPNINLDWFNTASALADVINKVGFAITAYLAVKALSGGSQESSERVPESGGSGLRLSTIFGPGFLKDGQQRVAPLGSPVFLPAHSTPLPPLPQGMTLAFGGPDAFPRQCLALLRRDGRRTAAQAAGAVESGPNCGECFSCVFCRVFGFRDNRFPKLCACPENPCLAGIFTVCGDHLLLFNDHAQCFVPKIVRNRQLSLKVIVGTSAESAEGRQEKSRN